MKTLNRPSLELQGPNSVYLPTPKDRVLPAPRPLEERHIPDGGSPRDPYRGVILILFLAALLGTVVAVAGGRKLSNPVLLDTAVTLGIAAGILLGVAVAQGVRLRSSQNREDVPLLPPTEEAGLSGTSPEGGEPTGLRVKIDRLLKTKLKPLKIDPRLAGLLRNARDWARDLTAIGRVRIGTAIAGLVGIVLVLRAYLPETFLAPRTAGIAAVLCLIAAALAATAARYLASIDTARLPEGPGLLRGARVVGWTLAVAALSIGLEWAGQRNLLRVTHFEVLSLNALACYGLLKAREEPGNNVFALDLSVLSALGSRANILASVLDSAERQLGIDLRSTWALSLVRRSIEPLVLGLLLVGWLSTSLTVGGVQDNGLVERLGVPSSGKPLGPGIHLHFPWPIDRVFRIPVLRVQRVGVGHEGEEAEGPENVLWAKEHAANEYTLLLGNGRDLITIDAAVQFRIVDPRAWRYHCQNPTDALRAIAYRAVMRNTVNRTLSEALSENVAKLTGRMRDMVQHEADAMGLGVQVMTFTVGGMHPPVMVASDYQAVVSAALEKVTAVVNANSFRNETVPAAEAAVVERANSARADGVEALAKAAGQAWSFRTLEAQYRAAPQEYFFRRRLETLEKSLSGHSFTVVDTRIQRDGAELWLTQ
jgi:regulator of protease activity HflC (stomatin/prohibitin superfamily)